MKRLPSVVALLAVFLLGSARIAAHDIPADVTVHAFVKPEQTRLRLLVRVPLRALLDVDFPRREDGSLDLARADASAKQAAEVWIARNIAVYEADQRLGAAEVVAARVSLPSDKAFASYEGALAHATGARLPVSMQLYWEHALFDALLEYPIHSERSAFSIHPALARLGLRVVTVLRFLPPDGTVRAFEYTGDPGMVRLDPRWHQAAMTFVRLGFVHIVEGIDHLLFLLCLVIPLRRLRPLVVVVTSFTVAHSITLAAAAAGAVPDALWFPPLVETLIAASIVYMAIENIVSGGPASAPPPPRLRRGLAVALRAEADKASARSRRSASREGGTVARRWMMAFAFGLVHGFGFSFALRESLQFAGSHLTTSLVAFNAGVELGQLFVLALMLPALHLVFRFAFAERIGTIVLSAFVAHTGWHWMIERGDRLRQFPWPAMDAATLASAMRWAMALLVLTGLVWIARSAVPRLRALIRV